MIISHLYKYLFIEIPRTGTTAISKELIDMYNGEHVLHKHATYSEFKRSDVKITDDYFIFSSKRNPLDRCVSEYLKYKYNHNDALGKYSGRVANAGLNPLKYFRAKYFLKRVQFAQKEGTEFSDYYLNFFNKSYCDFGFTDHPECDFVIKFESLTDDFQEALIKMGVEPKRTLPHVNKTKNKEKVFWDYYTDEILSHTVRNKKIYFQISNYSFPDNWPKQNISLIDWLRFYYYNLPKIIYWKYFTNK
jgi:hypothetical protein